jgi:hypothetical protein
MQSYDDKHPKGTKYRPEELRLHRDRWFDKVSGARPTDYTEEHRDLDRALFRRIFALLTRDGPIAFLSNHHFAAPFEYGVLGRFQEFDATNEDPSWEFLDPTLDATRATLAHNVHGFLSVLSRQTFTNPDGRYSVAHEWKHQNQGERYYEALEQIESAAATCVDSYNALLRESRHRLAVEVPEAASSAG